VAELRREALAQAIVWLRAHVGLVLLGFVTALGTLGVNILGIVAGLGMTGFALGFALKDSIANLLAGVTRSRC
jgi:small-conductance mechanosensitive channel